MKIKNRNYVIVAAVFVLLTSGICFASDDNDFQYWSAAGFSFDLDKDWKAVVTQELRIGESAGNLYYEHTEIGLVYSGLADWLDVGFDYRQISETDSAGVWRDEHRPQLNVTLKGKLCGLDLADRSRLEYRDRENKTDLWRYRNKLTLKLPMELTPLKLKPYIADEIFIDLNEVGYNKNRIYAGFSFDLTENLKGAIFYLWQTTRTGGVCNDINVLGTSFRFTF
ncbi:MAG: DUF2490 domain-containing protein [Planctomycetota bacterium]|jgi:hypothetical protein